MLGPQLLVALLLNAGIALGSTTVKITNGTISGKACSSNTIEFQSVPYALPPVGSLRFQPPQPYNMSFNGTLDATQTTPNCLQFGKTGAEPGVQSEDCLFLDLWMPANATSSSGLPVKFYVYGGFDDYGSVSAATYNGCNLASDAVVVSVNYRVGPLGWLALPSAGIAGNMGLQDILLGLEWVQENIAAFGGDKEKVLLFGQSAGATNVFAISTLPQAPRLMKSAIMESGGGRYFPTVQEYQPLMASFVEALGCSVNDLSCIQSKSGSQLNETMINQPNNVAFNNPPNAPFAASPPNNDSPSPLVDGTIVPESPLEAGSKVPSIYGSNSQDGNLFVFETYGSAGIENLTINDYSVFLIENFGTAASTVNQTYPVSDFAQTPYPIFFAMAQIITDSAFFCPAYRGLVNTAAKGVPVWTYLFNHTTTSCSWVGSAVPLSYLELLGSTHTAELPYVFDHLSGYPQSNGSAGNNCTFDNFEQAMSKDIVGVWTAMAENGSPQGASLAYPSPDTTLQGTNTTWPQFEPGSSQGINFGNNTISAGTVDYSMCTKFWDVLDAKILQNSTGSTGFVNPSSNASSTAAGASGSIPPVATHTGAAGRVDVGVLVGGLTIGMALFGLS